jgi:hypothetical protein
MSAPDRMTAEQRRDYHRLTAAYYETGDADVLKVRADILRDLGYGEAYILDTVQGSIRRYARMDDSQRQYEVGYFLRLAERE